MRVLFVSANKETINMLTLPLGMGCVAQATVRAGHEVQTLDLLSATADPSLLRRTLQNFDPEVIAVSVRNIDDQVRTDTKFLLADVQGLLTQCRAFSQAPVVLGGAGYSIFPEAALAYLGADMGIQGEGEAAFPALLERLARGADVSGVPGLYTGGHGCQGVREYEKELDRFSLPEAPLWIPSGCRGPDLWVPVQTRRGCPMRCTYCSTAAIEGRRIRRRSPHQVVRWIAGHVEAGYRQFMFVDNTFNLPADYAREICRLLIEERLQISWSCILHPSRTDPGLIRDMARAGCEWVSLGFESGSERMLRSMRKGFRRDEVRKNSEILAANGIRQIGFLLLGGPGETRESVEESFAFADALPADTMNITAGVRIYPHTELAAVAVQEGILLPEDDLLFPRFYLARGLDGWLQETVAKWAKARPHWMT